MNLYYKVQESSIPDMTEFEHVHVQIVLKKKRIYAMREGKDFNQKASVQQRSETNRKTCNNIIRSFGSDDTKQECAIQQN
jgi:hypothetical protein